MKFILTCSLLIFIVFASCSKYQKVLKSDNMDYKYEMAVKYYNKEDYVRAYPLFEELYGIYRGTERAEDAYRYYAYCCYHSDDVMIASYHFKNFTNTYPTSKYAEECLYMSAYCNYVNSPEYSLDQTNTGKAIREFQLFINTYPASTRLEECNNLIDELRIKLETKAYKNAKLYYHIGEYKAAIVAMHNAVKDFPATQYREELTFLSMKSNYLLAINSIPEKKEERLRDAVKAYNLYVASFPEGLNKKNAKSIYDNTIKELDKINHLNSMIYEPEKYKI